MRVGREGGEGRDSEGRKGEIEKVGRARRKGEIVRVGRERGKETGNGKIEEVRRVRKKDWHGVSIEGRAPFE